MTIFSECCNNRLSHSTWYKLWQESRQRSHQADPEDASDRIAACPPQFATGYKRDIDLRNGIDLTLHRYKFHDDLTLTQMQPEDNRGHLEFVFNLSSVFKFWEGAYIIGEQHYLLGMYNPGCKGESVLLAREPTLEVDLHLKPDLLQSLIGLSPDRESDRIKFLSSDLRQIIEGKSDKWLSPVQAITPAMQVALQQILDCPYQGIVKQMYLESKSVEVLALWLEQALQYTDTPKPSTRRRPSDEIERLTLAKEILTQQVNDPPSLMALARQVGLNDCTLKRGFREVFGTTVFGYLHHHRLEQARSLLLENQLSVTAIAHTVGYQDVSAFGRAFRKKFGVCPRSFHRTKLFL
ncbi:MAG: helix-turn-helix transcriptional regulator [Cyanophyceae cyanobacterium]